MDIDRDLDSVEIYTLYQHRMMLYKWYSSDMLTLHEYLELIKPLDQAIDRFEMSTLRGILVSKESS